MNISGVIPYCTIFFGIVRLLKPVVPSCPVKVKVTVINRADLFVVIVTLDIWELVIFPLIAKLTFVPLSVLAIIVVSNGVEEGDGFVVGLEVACGFPVDVGVGVGIRFGVGDGTGVGDGDGVSTFVTVNELLVPE